MCWPSPTPVDDTETFRDRNEKSGHDFMMTIRDRNETRKDHDLLGVIRCQYERGGDAAIRQGRCGAETSGGRTTKFELMIKSK